MSITHPGPPSMRQITGWREHVGLDLRGAEITMVHSDDLVLHGCDLSGAHITWCRFGSLSLVDCVLEGAVLENVVITSDRPVDLTGAECHRVLVNGTMLDRDPEMVLTGACWLLEQMHNLFD